MSDDCPRKGFTVRHGVLVGGACAVLGYGGLIALQSSVYGPGSPLPPNFGIELVSVTLIGVFVGAICAPVVSWAVRWKPLTPVLVWLSLVLAPVTAGCMFWGSSMNVVPRLLIAVSIPAGAGILTAYTLRFLLSDAPLPGFCQNCHYNLTGNVSGVCPECGTEV